MGYAYDQPNNTVYIYDRNDPAGGHVPGTDMSLAGLYAYLNANFPGVMVLSGVLDYLAYLFVRMGYAAGVGFTNDLSGNAQTTFMLGYSTYGEKLRMMSTFSFATSGGSPLSALKVILNNPIGSGEETSSLFYSAIEQSAVWSYSGDLLVYGGALRCSVGNFSLPSSSYSQHKFYDAEINAPGTFTLGSFGTPVAEFYRSRVIQSNDALGTSMFPNGINVGVFKDSILIQKRASYLLNTHVNSPAIIRQPRIIFGTNPANAYIRTTLGGATRAFFAGFPWKSGIWRFDQTYSLVRLSTSVVAMGGNGNLYDLGVYRPRIIDAAGNPVPGARVKITNSRPASIGGPTVEVDVLTDANGNCTWTPIEWTFLTPITVLDDCLYLGAYTKKPTNPGANPNYNFTHFGPFTIEVTKGADKVTRALHWPTKQASDAYGWYPVDELYDVITIPAPLATSDQTYYGQAELRLMLDELGQDASVAGVMTRGILERRTVEILEGEGGPVLAIEEVLTIETGSLPALAIGVAVSVDGISYKAADVRQRRDGALTDVLLARE